MTQPAYKRRPLWLTAKRLEILRAVQAGQVCEYAPGQLPPSPETKLMDRHRPYFLLDRGKGAPWPPSRWLTVTAAMNFLHKQDVVERMAGTVLASRGLPQPWRLTKAGKEILMRGETQQ